MIHAVTAYPAAVSTVEPMASKMARGLRALVVLLEELDPVPITHMVVHFGP